MSVERNIEAVRRFYSSGPAAEASHGRPLFADDAVWHVPGDNPVSGEYVGVDAIARGRPRRMAPLDTWRVRVIDVMGNADHVVATIHLEGERRGKTIDTAGAHVFRLDDKGRIVEVWGFAADQDGLDEFFRA